jgi:exodeoxyribonuclease VII large subunit
VDIVAHTRLKTPTAVAEFLISGVSQFDAHLTELKDQFFGVVFQVMAESKNNMEHYTRVLTPITREKITKANSKLIQTIWKLDNSVKLFIQNKNYQLGRKEEVVHLEFRIFTQKQRGFLERTSRVMSGTLRQVAIASQDQLTRKKQRFEFLIRSVLSENIHYLNLSGQKALLTDPQKILARGYSITTYNGRALKDASMVNPLALIETKLYNGKLISEVKTVKQKR